MKHLSCLSDFQLELITANHARWHEATHLVHERYQRL